MVLYWPTFSLIFVIHFFLYAGVYGIFKRIVFLYSFIYFIHNLSLIFPVSRCNHVYFLIFVLCHSFKIAGALTLFVKSVRIHLSAAKVPFILGARARASV